MSGRDKPGDVSLNFFCLTDWSRQENVTNLTWRENWLSQWKQRIKDFSAQEDRAQALLSVSEWWKIHLILVSTPVPCILRIGWLGLDKNTILCSVYSDNGKWYQVGILHEETKLLANQEVFPPACDCCKRAKVFLTSVPYLVQDEFFKQKFKRQNESDFCQRFMVKCTKCDSYETCIFLEWAQAEVSLVSRALRQMNGTFSFSQASTKHSVKLLTHQAVKHLNFLAVKHHPDQPQQRTVPVIILMMRKKTETLTHGGWGTYHLQGSS